MPIARRLLKPICCKYYDDQNPDALKILFIGNSLTYTNELPLVLANFLFSPSGAPPNTVPAPNGLKFHMVVQGGFTLEDNWNHKVAMESLTKHGPWDYVVLQEQSIRTLEDRTKVFKYAELFAQEIRNIGAQVVIFSSWSLRNNPDANETVVARLAELAEHLNAINVPIGKCWLECQAAHPTIELYTDDIHPNEVGTYLAACAFYCILSKLSPIGLPNRIQKSDGKLLFELNQENVRAAQEAAMKICKP